MNNYELNYNNDEEILNCIKKIILNRHPIVQNRLDILYPYFDQPLTPEMEIDFRFHKINDNDITHILFLDGTDNHKESIHESITINGLISKKAIYDLINYLLTDHDWIKNICKYDTYFQIPMDVGGCEENMHGISCGEINLKFDFYRHPNKQKMLNEYLKFIAINFYEQLKNTSSVKRELSNYCDLVKKEFINSLTDDNLKSFFCLLNNEDLYNLIFSLPNNRFIELYNEYIKQEDQKQLTKI